MTCEDLGGRVNIASAEENNLHLQLTSLRGNYTRRLRPWKEIGEPELKRLADLQAEEDEARQRLRAVWDAWTEALRLHPR